MLEFRGLQLSDKELIEPYLAMDGAIMTDRTFASLYIWRELYDVQICIKDGFLYSLSKDHQSFRTYYMPLGNGDLAKAFETIEADAKAVNMPYKIYLVTPAGKAEIEEKLPEKYDFFEDRDNFDYIYRAEDLIALKGKKYHSKRNYINRFRQNYEGRWRYENVDPAAHMDIILNYTREWDKIRQGDGFQEDYRHELEAVKTALVNFDCLKMRGGILWVDDKIVAYTLATIASDNVIDIMFEKADADCDGAYPMINNQFAIHNFEDIELVNREEDMGIPGLRTAKLSYNPIMFGEKYIATLNEV